MSNENKAIVYRLIDEVWNQRKLDMLDELVAPDAVIHSPTVPDLSRRPEEADDMVAEGEKVALRWSGYGTHKGKLLSIEPTGKSMRITGQAIYSVVAGKIEEDWINADTLGMLQQLGIVPPFPHRPS